MEEKLEVAMEEKLEVAMEEKATTNVQSTNLVLASSQKMSK